MERGHRPRTGLILSGGGARAAYQVGVLKAVADLLPPRAGNPFPVICGTSAGAINAVGLASHASRFRTGVRGLEAVWGSFHAGQVYRTDLHGMLRRALQWFSAIFFAGIGARRPISLLDNSPLVHLLQRLIHFERVERAIEAGDLHAVSVTASCYGSGQSVCFFQGKEGITPWRRARRIGRRATLGLEHLLASAAIPAIFPAVSVGGEYYGDGSVRQLAPISPALHLGADRVMVIGVSADTELSSPSGGLRRQPTPAEMAGHLLNSAFLDSLEGDLERLERINRTLDLLPDEARASRIGLRPVQVLTIAPSEPINEIAVRYARELPRRIRFFLRGSGATDSGGSVLISYILFEAAYCRALMRLGYDDAMRREHEVLRFLGHDPIALHGPAGLPRHDIC
ncbi:patatin-like phospholipase family protein [Alkalilimnicola sp. S0819]|uniref:patatin-like phospholipase family protein n=1 Tax=Alkalilimnicola sp. S0819 TaxID=2613922 RepID=UPI001262A8FA|nr:patatin-like phospholipase family protein [Alkalilimnicola sp. S0819]KAB7619551.1 patatin-like phospholipase family protein [Alkalilimnicola sp. S0819]MPQ17655.1 patatin-like phospholipase family protein [Alkalilimnicola sp. S0819]